MDQIQVKVIQPQLLHRSLERFLCALIACILYPQFRGDEQLLTRDAAFPNSGAHRFFVEIGGCRIDKPVAHRECLAHSLFTNGGFGHLENAKAFQRHFHTV